MRGREKIEAFFVNALKKRVFSGASWAFSQWKNKGFERQIQNFGYTHEEESKKEIQNDIFFDLASLTKPLVTVLSLSHLLHQKKISLESTLSSFFPRYTKAGKKDIQLHHLLSHCSGLPAHSEYFWQLNKVPESQRKQQLLESILNEELLSHPNEKHVYSDLGYMLLGLIVEQASGKKLDQFWRENISVPLGIDKIIFFPGSQDLSNNSAATVHGPWSGKLLQGVVHDDNCRSLGGVCGHAGLFGTVEGVLYLCEAILNIIKERDTSPGFGNMSLQEWIKRIPGSNWCLGFDMPSRFGSSSGRYFSSRSIGHLGFTGVSFWIDLESEIILVLLTNRTLMSENSKDIKLFRPQFHNMVREYLERKRDV